MRQICQFGQERRVWDSQGEIGNLQVEDKESSKFLPGDSETVGHTSFTCAEVNVLRCLC